MPINEIDPLTKEHAKISKALGELARQVIVVATTQTIFGRINMNVYSTGRDMRKLGIIGDYSDMSPGAAFIKLAALSEHKKDAKRLMGECLKERSLKVALKRIMPDYKALEFKWFRDPQQVESINCFAAV